MRSRHAPRPIGSAIEQLAARAQPITGLAQVQRVWADAVGERIAREATPTAERDGVLTVSCRSSAWASDLDLLGPELVERVNALLGGARIVRLRCIATTTRAWASARQDRPG